MNKKRIRQMTASLLRRLTTQPNLRYLAPADTKAKLRFAAKVFLFDTFSLFTKKKYEKDDPPRPRPVARPKTAVLQDSPPNCR